MKAIIILSLLLSTSAFGAKVCQTTRGEKSFEIEGETLVVHVDKLSGDRGIASIKKAEKLETKRELMHSFEMNGELHVLGINKESTDDNYLLVANKEGHKVLYQVDCK